MERINIITLMFTHLVQYITPVNRVPMDLAKKNGGAWI